MEWPDIRKRIQAGEDQHTEFKRGVDLRQIGPALSAFANSEGGVLLLGVDDDQTIVGVKDNPETVTERLTAFLQSACRRHSTRGWDVSTTRSVGCTRSRYRVSAASSP